MIAFDLQCKKGHAFEGWFKDREAFEDQLKKGLVTCPVCNDAAVIRIPSSFGIKKSSSAPPALTEEMATIEVLRRKVYDYVEKNFDDVGCDFAKEALKIHYGAAEPRNIRGVSTKEEEKILEEEGVEVVKIPVPPDKADSDA